MPVLGIRFYPTSFSVESGIGAPIFVHGTVDHNRSDFDLIFEPLYSDWEGSLFLDQDGIIRISDSELSEEEEDGLTAEMESYIHEERKNSNEHIKSKLVNSSVFRRFGRYVYEFEGAGFCLLRIGTTLEKAIEIERYVWSRESLDDLPSEAICLIQNWDGVFWQIFTKDPNLLQRLCDTHCNNASLPAYWVELSKDFPIPRGSSPDAAKMKKVEQDASSNGG
jgi:hypothetical protein